MKKNLFLLLTSFLIWGSSCSDDNGMIEPEVNTLTALAHDQGECGVCTFDFINEDILKELDNPSNSPSTRAVLEKSYKWKAGDTIRIKFLNGDSFSHDKVKKYAIEWTQYANLKLVFVPNNENADIKIAFKWNGNESSSSYIGTMCRFIPQDIPSMHFGWFTASTSESAFRSTILHEFGHALGLRHEHQHPQNPIQWNKPVVYEYYANEGWSLEKIENNLFQKYSTSATNYSSYDKLSIMHYSIPASHTLDGYSVVSKEQLSATDKEFIAKEYPYPISLSGKSVPADYDGDGKTDIAYKTDSGIWYIDYANNGFGRWDISYSGYGDYRSMPAPADYDGDGKADLSIKDPKGAWYIDYAKNGFGTWDVSYAWYGELDAIPVPADYDGDGKIDLSIKHTRGVWHIDYAKNDFGRWDVSYSGYGELDSTPVPADYDGDGKADLSVKDSKGNWCIDYANNGFGKWDAIYSGYGDSRSIPAPADYDGDGKADLSVKDSKGAWCVDYANNGFGTWDVTYPWYGELDATPVPADYDGDGKIDLSIKHTRGLWYIDYSKNGFGRWDWSYQY